MKRLKNKRSPFRLSFLYGMLFSIVMIFFWSCQKEPLFDPIEEPEYFDQKTKDFFDWTFLKQTNPNLREAPEIRTEDPIVNELYNYLLQKNITNPFAAQLSDAIGYPYWNAAEQFEDFPIVLVPFFNESDSEINGIMYNFRIADGEWQFTYGTKDVIQQLITDEVDEINIPYYGITNETYNHELFGEYDVQFYELMINLSSSQDSLLSTEEKINDRCSIIWWSECLPNMVFTDQTEIILPRNRDCPEGWTEIFYQMDIDCPGGGSNDGTLGSLYFENGIPWGSHIGGGSTNGSTNNSNSTDQQRLNDWMLRCEDPFGSHDPGAIPLSPQERANCRLFDELHDCLSGWMQYNSSLVIWYTENGYLPALTDFVCANANETGLESDLTKFKELKEGDLFPGSFEDFSAIVAAYKSYYESASSTEKQVIDDLIESLQGEGLSLADFKYNTGSLLTFGNEEYDFDELALDEEAIPLLIPIIKSLGATAADALLQSFFIWLVDDDVHTFGQAIGAVNKWELTGTFLVNLFIPKSTAVEVVGRAGAVAVGVVIDNCLNNPETYTAEDALADFTAVFFRQALAEAIGEVAGKYFSNKLGRVLTKADIGGKLVKKFNLSNAPLGVPSLRVSYGKICKWLGGSGLIENPPFPPKTIQYLNTQTDELITETITPDKMMSSWNNDKVFIMGRIQATRIEQYKNALISEFPNMEIKSICDSPLWDCDSFDESVFTLEVNKEIIQNMKEEGFSFIDIGNPPFSLPPSSNYLMELAQIFE